MGELRFFFGLPNKVNEYLDYNCTPNVLVTYILWCPNPFLMYFRGVSKLPLYCTSIWQTSAPPGSPGGLHTARTLGESVGYSYYYTGVCDRDLCASRKPWRSPYCMYSKIISGALSSLVSAELIPVRARQKERLDIIVTMYAAIVAPQVGSRGVLDIESLTLLTKLLPATAQAGIRF